MTVKRLVVTNLRNLKAVDLLLSPGLNVFYGDNGSGKTSVLEAVSILSLGRSFRSRKFKSLINYDASSYTVFGVVLDDNQVQIPVGIQRSANGEVIIKKAGQRCSAAAELAQSLPIRVINGHSFALLEGSPQNRRQFLDWLVFHVEHEFFDVWRAYEKCLKQRNSLIRRGKIDRLMLDSWDAELALAGERLHAMRRAAFDLLEVQCGQLLATEGVGIDGLRLKYSPGWDTEQSLREVLRACHQRDIDLGYTLQGPHRADLKLYQGKNLAVEVLSRGQQKVSISALHIAQGMVLKEQLDKRCVYLIDDLPAELDSNFRFILAGWLIEMGSQVFVTGVERAAVLGPWQDLLSKKDKVSTKVFHVEHGSLTPEVIE
ncbi:DNA replication/repair protein RecF [Pseudomaricurvus alcaniphilus]|uniref:DNA replication/repair protein RecF n=1 Tax=Pseudomaricurvus alcaniphilus TaxID=1166482 RepID=UPI001407E987|nr:DNA replication/repair protein RecF [Pseudomaricurvus alcaniphilus]NHN38823.1 DNA replication/repair protein RecF [Pseudomaricurvus alcaniphilus]